MITKNTLWQLFNGLFHLEYSLNSTFESEFTFLPLPEAILISFWNFNSYINWQERMGKENRHWNTSILNLSSSVWIWIVFLFI